MEILNHDIHVRVDSFYVPEQSDPTGRRFTFGYSVVIRNNGSVPARLKRRHWVITDADGRVQEVDGVGVVGETPYLKPGEGFEYTSGAVLETPVGAMHGYYTLIGDDGIEFEAEIPVFTLTRPHFLN